MQTIADSIFTASLLLSIGLLQLLVLVHCASRLVDYSLATQQLKNLHRATASH